MSRFVRNTVFGSATALATTLGSFLISLEVARLLGVAELGAYSFSLWIITTAATLTGAGLPFTLGRFLTEVADTDGDGAARQLARRVLPWAAVGSLAPAALAVLYSLYLQTTRDGSTLASQAQDTLHDPVCWLLIGVAGSTLGIANFARGYLRGLQKLDRVAMLNAAAALLQIALIAAGALLFGIRGCLAGTAIGAALPCLALVRLAGTEGAAAPGMLARIGRFTRYRWASEIAAAFVFSRIEIVFLRLTWTPLEVGLLATALTLANLATQGPLMLTWGILPRLSEQFARNDKAGLRETYAAGTRVMAFLIFPACFGLAALLPELLPMLYGKTFAGAVPAAILLVLAASTAAISAIGSNLIWAMEKTDVDLYFGLAGAAVSVGIGLPLIAHYGLMGAVAARILTQTMVVGLAAAYIVRTMGFGLPLASLAKILLASASCALAARGCLLVLHGAMGLAVAIGVGALCYLRVTSWLRALEPEDERRVARLFRWLPSPLGLAGRRLYRML